MTEEQKARRADFAKAALEDRYQEAQRVLDGERQVHQYLIEKNQDGAARQVEANIRLMERRVKKYGEDLTPPA